MKHTTIKVFVIALGISLFGCKTETKPTLDYKFAQDGSSINCPNTNTKLFEEAVLSFEEDIKKYFNQSTNNLPKAYSSFLANVNNRRMDYQAAVSPHSMEVFEALKAEAGLFNEDHSVNYQAPIFECVSNNFSDKDFQTTFKALVATNSMRAPLIAAPLRTKIRRAPKDRYLATFVALDWYYSKLFDVDPTQVTEKPANENEPRVNPTQLKNAERIQSSQSEK